jgi:hypothetical protein
VRSILTLMSEIYFAVLRLSAAPPIKKDSTI